ncbi:uncharacterized protein LOC115677465 [Syzygium oleosum]|uniref:uncharacterized protein LOC115677465 n=1 Tax=Syzygium oleosum TaxID=219896 RepID=UPI0011D275A1|nr:uncharacterized protein LOC115677465 [Syzygium oleosum]XP_056176720.1 uncharacterized protein LOC115677465 [Syzygium oleosum]
MGTKLQYAINPLAVASPSSHIFSFHRVDERDYFENRELKESIRNTGVNKFIDPMDQVADKDNIESIRKTIQMHEDIFKQQVQELHRLYSVQKMLMSELKKEIEQNRIRNTMRSSETNYVVNWPQQTSQPSSSRPFHLQSLSNDPSSNERSSISCVEAIRRPRGFDLESPAKENSNIDEELPGPSFSNPRKNEGTSIEGSDEETEVELTLSIGGKRGNEMSKSYQQHYSKPEAGFSRMNHKELISSSSHMSERGDACSGPTTSIGGSATASDRERKQAHWLFQV